MVVFRLHDIPIHTSHNTVVFKMMGLCGSNYHRTRDKEYHILVSVNSFKIMVIQASGGTVFQENLHWSSCRGFTLETI